MGLWDRMWGWLAGRGDRARSSVPALAGPVAESSGVRVRERIESYADSLFNPLTWLGGSTDKGDAARPDPYHEPLTDDELRLLYRFNGISRRIIRLLPERATRKGWTVPDIGDEDRRLKTFNRVRQAMTWGRLYGGSALLLVTDDEVPAAFEGREWLWLQQPLDLRRVVRLVALQALDAFEAWPSSWDTNVRSPGFRGPKTWQISTDGLYTTVHATRIIHFRGAERSPSEMRHGMDGGRMPDDSVLQAVWDEVRRLTETMQGGATLAQEIRESVFKIGDLPSKQAGDEASALKEWIRLILQGRGILGATVLGPNDSYENRSNPPTGFNELSSEAKEMLSAVTGIPQVILFGSTPEGLNTDGESAWEGFRQLASDLQEENRDNIERIYQVLYASQEGPTRGVAPPDWELTFASLDEPSAHRTAELREAYSRIDSAYISMGVYTPADVARSRFGRDGYSTEMLPVAVAEEDPALEAAVEAERQAIEASMQAPLQNGGGGHALPVPPIVGSA